MQPFVKMYNAARSSQLHYMRDEADRLDALLPLDAPMPALGSDAGFK